MNTYDEFGLFHENADEAGLAYGGPPEVRRFEVDGPSGHRVSALRWGSGDPELVLLHGGAQNAHTWDTVALALERPLLAVDLPGHGRSQWRDAHDYRPVAMVDDVAAVLDAHAPSARLVCGMSLGGMTAISLAVARPDLVPRLAVIDVTPGVTAEKAEQIIAFVAGPESFETFDDLLERTVMFNPTRSESSLRRGILHNASEQADGSWQWRYDRNVPNDVGDIAASITALWDAVDRIACPILLLRGSLSPVVSDEDVDEWMRRQPDTRIEIVEDAGHSIQGDRPLDLARLLEDFLEP